MPGLSKTRVFRAYRLAVTVLGTYLAAWIKKHLLGHEGDWIQLHRANAARIVATFTQLRGIYLKIGQSLSMMANFLPEELIAPLETLQDQAPPTPLADIEAAIEREFGQSAQTLFAHFDPAPLASASLGQVHKATLTNGDTVAVKIQHPYIATLVRKDLKTLKKIFMLFHLAFPRYGIKTVYREFAEMIEQELDFHLEGEHCEALAANLQDMPCVFPKVYWDYTTRKILTTAFVAGIKISRLDSIDRAGINRRALATTLLHAYCRQIFVNGLYHADPHAGNLLVQEGPKIVFLDFGATARISTDMRLGITRFVEGLIRKDTKMLGEALKQMGFVAKGDKEEASERIVEYFYRRMSELNIENVFKDMTNFDTLSKLISPRQLDFSFRELATTFHIPREWVLLERTLLLLAGTCAQLDPDLNPTDIVLPYVEAFVLGKDRHFSDFIVELLRDAGTSYLRMGVQVSQTLRKLERGEIAVKVTLNPSLEREFRRGFRLMASTAVFLASGFLLYKSKIDPALASWQPFFYWASGGTGVMTLFLFMKKK